MAGWQGRVIQLWKSFEKPEVIFWVKSSLSFLHFIHVLIILMSL